MRSNRRARRFRRALVIWLIIFLAGILVGSNCGVSTAEAHPLQSSVEQPSLVLEGIGWEQVINTAETTVEAILSGETVQTRRFLPDGHIDASVRVMGVVRAGISPFSLDSNRISGSLAEGVTIHLEDPVVTESYLLLDSCLWRYDHNLWAWMPGEEALQLREQMLNTTISTLHTVAAQSGLLEAAKSNSFLILIRLFKSLGVNNICVVYDSGAGYQSSLSEALQSSSGGETVPGGKGAVKTVAMASICIGMALMVAQHFHRRSEDGGIAASAGLGIRAAFVRELEAIGLFNAADYNGSAFVRDSIPIKILGVKVGQTSMWVTAPGTVHAAVDLSWLTEADVSTTADGTLRVTLPSPVISGCEIDRANADIQRPSCISLCGITAERLSGLEDSLFIRAQEVLVRQALDMGILERARENTEEMLRRLVARVSQGGSSSLMVVYSEEGGESIQCTNH